MGPTPKEKEKKKRTKIKTLKVWAFGGDSGDVIFSFIFFINFFLRFSSFCPLEFVGINTKSALRDEGYA